MKHDSCHIARIVVWFLGTSAVLLCSGILFLVYVGKTPDAGLHTLAGTAIGSLAALLTNTQGRQNQRVTDEPQPVTVENPASDPVPIIGAGNDNSETGGD